MSTLQKTPKQGKKKFKHRSTEQILCDSIPDSPILQDFIHDAKTLGCDLEKSFSLEESENIESEIQDAVREEDATQIEEISSVERKIGNISLASTSKKSKEFVGTELVEINCFSKQMLELQVDTRLESPVHVHDHIVKRPRNIEPIASRTSQVEPSNKNETIEIQDPITDEMVLETQPFINEEEHILDETQEGQVISRKTSYSDQLIIDMTGKEQATSVRTVTCDKAVAPTAPIIAMEVMKSTVIPMKVVEDTHSAVKPVAVCKDEVVEIRPFTETQLAALYVNHELEQTTELASQFVSGELRDGWQNHVLYQLLQDYQRARARLSGDKLDLTTLQTECGELGTRLWTVEMRSETEAGECQDGNPVWGNHEHQVCHLDRAVLAGLSRTLGNTRQLITDTLSLHQFMCAVAKLRVDHFVGSVSSLDLRGCVSVLFSFQRRPQRDPDFLLDSRQWLSILVSRLLREATWADHLFLLHHVLRCPPGVTRWGAGFIQAPTPTLSSDPFCNSHLDHIVAALATILHPVQDRQLFLQQSSLGEGGLSSQECPWVLVDSEGEEEDEGDPSTLRESDLVALLNQMPLDALYRHVLLVTRRDNRDVHDVRQVTERHMLRLFAFTSALVRLFATGLASYGGPRYRQFTKRLGRLILHSAQYATDQWQSFRTCHVGLDPAMLERLQTEYDAFLLRVASCLFSCCTAWQFLAALPYSVLSYTTLWELFHLLSAEDAQLEDALVALPEAECCYLLTTMANMAVAREDVDWDFVQSATLHLMRVGFVSEPTRDRCSKYCRVLIANITSKHPALLSNVLATLRDNFDQASEMAPQLLRDLPLSLWVPTEQDLATLTHWLMDQAPTSPRSALSRLILSGLDWSCSPQGPTLGRHRHKQVALLVVDAVIKHSPQTTSASLGSMVRPQSLLAQWGWEMVSRLRLHALDQAEHDVCVAITNPGQAFHCVPSLHESQGLEGLAAGVKDRHPLACYVAVLLTTWGHSVPLICTKGLAQLQVLQCYQQHDAVLDVLHLVVPLFLDCEDSLLGNDKFLSVLISLVTADRSYVKLAKSLLAPEFPGPVLRSFECLLESHLQHHRRFSLVSPRPFISLWLRALALVPDWVRDRAVLHLVDVVLRRAFQQPDTWHTASQITAVLHQKSAGPRHGNTFSSLVSWVASGTAYTSSLLVRTSNPECAWFAYHVLELEQEILEERTGLWMQLLHELAGASGKANVDGALKRATHSLKLATPASASLALYRWAQQALDTPLGHPLLPLFWHKFFLLFLARVPSSSGVLDRGGVGDKFFEGMVNLSFHKKLKKRLQDATEYYRAKSRSDVEAEKSANIVEATQSPKLEFYARCSQLMRTFSLWLEEPRLHEPKLFLPALPPPYNSAKLVSVLQGDKKPWLEYLDVATILEEQQQAVNQWLVSRHRTQDCKVVMSTLLAQESNNPSERIVKRLQGYDAPVPPPSLPPCNPVLPQFDGSTLYNPDAVLEALKPCLKSLVEFAQIHSLRTSELTALDCNLVELAALLYRDVECEVVVQAACNSEPKSLRNQHVTCAGPAVITLKLVESRLNESTQNLMEQNRADYQSVLSRSLQSPPQKVCSGSVLLEQVIAWLVAELARNKDDPRLRESGVGLFYHVASVYNEETSLHPPSKQLLTSCLESLGQVFVSGDESQCLRLVAAIVEQPHLGGLLAPHLTPAATSTPAFLQLYAATLDSLKHTSPDLGFVLLSKFDVMRWLESRRPRLGERSQFITLVGNTLTTAGLNPPEQQLMVHEALRKHLRALLLHEFPEHYGEILNLVLRGSELQTLSVDVWYDLVNAPLSTRGLSVGMHPGQVREEARRYATEQRQLSHTQLRELAALLGNHFTRERLQYGLYGLYPKYRVYVEPLAALLGIVGHALVVATLQSDRGTTLSDKLCEGLWPPLLELFSPWLAPYQTGNLREPTAAWIQQLTDDRSVLLPWIPTDGPHAHRVMSTFTETLRFILDTLPGSSNVLSFLWQFYVTSFGHTAVKPYISGVVHTSVLTLPWDRLWPSSHDLELMLKVVDQYLPDAHQLLGAVFVEVSWGCWLDALQHSPPAALARAHVCLLHLLVKLAGEPSFRQSSRASALLSQSLTFQWHLVDAAGYEPVINWFVMSCNPRVVLGLESEDSNQLDTAVLRLLQVSSGFCAPHLHPSGSRKRQMFIRASVKLLTSAASRYKSVLTKQPAVYQAAVAQLLADIEASSAGQVGECGLLLTELLAALNQPALCGPLVEGWCTFMSGIDGSSAVVRACLRVLPPSAIPPEALGTLLEAALEVFFSNAVGVGLAPDWGGALFLLQTALPRRPPLEDSLVGAGHLLSLHALLLKKRLACRDIAEEAALLLTLTNWLIALKPTEASEPKLPLLWGQTLELVWRQCEFSGDASIASNCLRKLCQSLGQLAGDKGGWSILGAIGLGRSAPVSIRGRLLSRALSLFVLAHVGDGSEAALQANVHQVDGTNINSCGHRNLSDEARRGIGQFEALRNNKQFEGLRSNLETMLTHIKDPGHSLHNSSDLLIGWATQLYPHQYLAKSRNSNQCKPPGQSQS